jgi:hypothetical protein
VRTSKIPLRNVDGDIIGVLGTFEDITERKQAEMEIARVNRSLRMLSDSNQALIRMTDEVTLLNEVCRISVEVGGFPVAWVGFAKDVENNTIKVMAHAGLDISYIERRFAFEHTSSPFQPLGIGWRPQFYSSPIPCSNWDHSMKLIHIVQKRRKK